MSTYFKLTMPKLSRLATAVLSNLVVCSIAHAGVHLPVAPVKSVSSAHAQKVLQPGYVQAHKITAASGDIKNIKFVGVHTAPINALKADLPAMGTPFSHLDTNTILNRLYQSQYFRTIKLEREGNTLLIVVQERPVIASINITGNHIIKTKILDKVLNTMGLRDGGLFMAEKLSQVSASLENQYNHVGKYAAKISTHVDALPGNRVSININISEGLYAHIQRINFVGNHVYSTRYLMKLINLSLPNLMAFFTGNDKFTSTNIQQAQQAITTLYQNNGYINFAITSTQVSLDPTHRQAFVTFNLHEGHQYRFSGFTVKGDTVLPVSQIEALIPINVGETYSKQTVLDAMSAIKSALGNEGYAFVNVNPVPVINKKNHTVSINFFINPGNKDIIHTINFSGNQITNDKVLRERMQISEGAVYNRSAVAASTLKFNQLRYLSNVNEQTVPVPGNNHEVNLNYNMKEVSANTFNFQIGYDEIDKLLISTGIQLDNAFGDGNSYGISTTLSKPYQSVSLNYTQPYFTLSGVSQSISVYLSRYNYADTDLASYATNSYGTTLQYGIPLSSFASFVVGGGFDHTRLLEPTGEVSLTAQQFIQQQGRSTFDTFIGILGWTYNSTNAAYFPTSGNVASLTTNIAVPGSDLEWYKLMGSESWYFPLYDSFTLKLRGDANYGNGYGKTSELPFYQNFYAGGWGSVRGFAGGSLGPQDTIVDNGVATEGQAIGGNLEVDSSINLLFPAPFAENNNRLRLGVFVDAGNAYSTFKSDTYWKGSTLPQYPSFSNLRFSTGVSLMWVTPIGPLGMSLAKPLNAKPGDDTSVFNFTLGGTF